MNKTHFKRATALTLVVTLVLCQGFVTGTPLTQVVSKVQNYVTGASTVKALRLPAAAYLSAQGSVTLNGHAAPTGATVFSGGGVKTAENSTAVLSFGTMAQVELANASDFTLAVEGKTLGGQLRAGRATIVAPAGVAVKIVTADGPVLADGREATVLTVDVTIGKTRVESNRSVADVTTPAGVEGATDDPPQGPQGGGPGGGGGSMGGGGGGGGFGGGGMMGLIGLAAGLTGLAAGMAAAGNDGDESPVVSPFVP